MHRLLACALLTLLAAGPAWAEDGPGAKSNRLAKERSPYLRQHASNPIDWYPWGAEAFAKAKREDKPIFLSIGYAACHWCHVMEHESFEHAPTGKLLDEAFVCVKVDREERPDVDRLYMNAVVMLAGRGGWPMTVLLTPEGKPFWGGTYLTRRQTQQLAQATKRRWDTQRGPLLRQAESVAARLKANAGGPTGSPTRFDDPQLLQFMQSELRRRYDTRRGGYRSSRKFPPHGALLYFLSEGKRHATDADRAWVRRTLDAMAEGGIHDQVGGGFHRYTVDDVWLVPHFEKMLYDNALLARAYALAGTPRDRRVADRIFAWIERDLKRPGGGYASSLDADTKGHEGTTYVWTPRQLAAALPASDRSFATSFFGVTSAGNFSEGWMKSARGRNILHMPRSLDAFVRRSSMSKGQVLAARDRVLGRLLAVRTKRDQPRLDDKVITSWNALLISAYAAADWNPAYLQRAEALAKHLATKHRAPDGALLRFPRGSGPEIHGFCEDYAHLVDALLDLDAARGDSSWRPIAEELAAQLIHRFHDGTHGGFFTNSEVSHDPLIVREKHARDSPIPSENATATRALLRIDSVATINNAPGFDTRRAADRTLALYRPAMATPGQAVATMSFARALALRLAQPEARPRAEHGWGVIASTRQDVFVVDVLTGAAAITPGRQFPIRVRIHLDKGWHAFLPDRKDGGGVHLQQAGASTVVLQGVGQRLDPQTRRLPDGWAGTFVWNAQLFAPKGTKPGRYTVPIEVRAQACTKELCRAPETIRLALPVVVRHPGR